MYKVTTKNGSIFFMTLEDALTYISMKENRIFASGAYVKITFSEDEE